MYSGDLTYPYRQGISSLNSCSNHESSRELDHENETLIVEPVYSSGAYGVTKTEARTYQDIGTNPKVSIDHCQNFVESRD